MDSKKVGSNTAKQGFKNEDYVVDKFNNWRIDIDAQAWLVSMEYDLEEIEYVEAVKISGYKTDVQVQVTIKLIKAIDVENLQVKLVSNKGGFNQIDKRWVTKYVELWKIPEEITKLLKYFTGESAPYIENPRDRRRIFANEFSIEEQDKLITFFQDNKALIENDILKGRGKFAAEWMLVIQKYKDIDRWVLKPINIVINYFSKDSVLITKRGSIKIGKITVQRKGGDGGRPTANMLQFKIDPTKLFDI